MLDCHLWVEKIHHNATLPTCAHPGEDLGYDLYALEDCYVKDIVRVKTGIAAHATDRDGNALGLLIRDRSSMAAKGWAVVGGVIDAGYTGEIIVLLKNPPEEPGVQYFIKAGQKIAQMIPLPILTGVVTQVNKLAQTTRGAKGFGSTGA